jgi:hypothetical protein
MTIFLEVSYVTIVKEAIGRLGTSQVFTGLVQRQAGMYGQLHSQLATASVQTSIVQLDVSKLIEAPLVFRWYGKVFSQVHTSNLDSVGMSLPHFLALAEMWAIDS